MRTHETQRDQWRIMRLRGTTGDSETNGYSRDSETPMGTHEIQRDYWIPMRPMGTHETQRD